MKRLLESPVKRKTKKVSTQRTVILNTVETQERGSVSSSREEFVDLENLVTIFTPDHNVMNSSTVDHATEANIASFSIPGFADSG